MRKLRYLSLGIAFGLVACNNDLTVPNTNNPDVERALARPGDVESFIMNSYGQMHQASFGVNASIMPSLQTMAFENASGLANWGLGPRSAIPRASIANSRGNPYEVENLVQYSRLPRAARVAANGVVALRRPGFTIGSPASDQRAMAFAYLVMGAANGNLALVYDSVSVVTPEDDVSPGAVAPLLGYLEGMEVALEQLDSAIAIGGRLPGFTLPVTAINGTAYSSAQMIAIARGWKARLRAGVARTPLERAAVNWAAVIADAGAALPGNLNITVLPAATGTVWTIATAQHELYDTWSQQPPMIIGMADSVRAGCSAANAGVGDCYDAWLATPLNSRYRFLIRTADQRFPPGETRDAQRTSSGSTPSANFPEPPAGTSRYYKNRRPTDPTGEAFGVSYYDFYRFQALWSTFNGSMPVMTRAEMDLLMAEGYIRTGDFVNAMARINISRVANGGLPPLTGITSATAPISTAGNCVPRVPQPPNFNTAACGNIMEAMKWEKRVETEMTHLGAWFIDARGWGDLPEGTPLHFPIPFQEMDARGKPSYNLGGLGGRDAATRGTYGF